jgi:hypothetical protein
MENNIYILHGGKKNYRSKEKRLGNFYEWAAKLTSIEKKII